MTPMIIILNYLLFFQSLTYLRQKPGKHVLSHWPYSMSCQWGLKPHHWNFNLNKDSQQASQQLPCQVCEREKLNLLYLFQVSSVIGLIWELNFIFCLSKIRPTGDRVWKQLCEAIPQMVGGSKKLLMGICSFNKPREMAFDSPLYKW